MSMGRRLSVPKFTSSHNGSACGETALSLARFLTEFSTNLGVPSDRDSPFSQAQLDKEEEMLSLLSRVKDSLSHVKASTWHYKAVHEIWGWRANEGKACTYYWFKLPTSLLALLMLIILGAIITVAAWFVGRTPTWFKTEDPYLTDYKRELCYPYGYTSKGKKRHVMPWWFGLVALFAGVFYYLAIANPVVGLITISVIGSMIGGVLILALLVFGITKNWNTPGAANARAKVKTAWDRACPPLVVVKNNEE